MPWWPRQQSPAEGSWERAGPSDLHLYPLPPPPTAQHADPDPGLFTRSAFLTSLSSAEHLIYICFFRCLVPGLAHSDNQWSQNHSSDVGPCWGRRKVLQLASQRSRVLPGRRVCFRLCPPDSKQSEAQPYPQSLGLGSFSKCQLWLRKSSLLFHCTVSPPSGSSLVQAAGEHSEDKQWSPPAQAGAPNNTVGLVEVAVFFKDTPPFSLRMLPATCREKRGVVCPATGWAASTPTLIITPPQAITWEDSGIDFPKNLHLLLGSSVMRRSL